MPFQSIAEYRKQVAAELAAAESTAKAKRSRKAPEAPAATEAPAPDPGDDATDQ